MSIYKKNSLLLKSQARYGVEELSQQVN